MKKLLAIILTLILSITAINALGYPIQITQDLENQKLTTHRILNTELGEFLFVGGNARVSKNLGIILEDNKDIILKENNKYKAYNTYNISNCKQINKQQKKLLKSLPYSQIKREWDKNQLIGSSRKGFVCFKYKDQIIAPGISQDYTPDIAVLEDIKFIVNNYKTILQDINQFNSSDDLNALEDDKMLEIRRYLTKNITYDHDTVDETNIENWTVDYDSAPGFYIKSYYENGSAVCGAISNIFGMYVNYLGLADMERISGNVYFQSNLGHALLKDGLGLYYDLTWDLNSPDRENYFALDKNKIQVYLESEDEGLIINNNFDYEFAKQLYKHNGVLFGHYLNSSIFLKVFKTMDIAIKISIGFLIFSLSFFFFALGYNMYKSR